VWTDRAEKYHVRSANHPVSRPLPRLPSCARPRPRHAPGAVVPAVLAPHPPPPQPIIAPPHAPDHPPAQRELSLSDDSQTPPHIEDTEMTDAFFDNGDGNGFESNDNLSVSDDAPIPPEIDDTEITEIDYDTEMTESFTDDLDSVSDFQDYGDSFGQ
jgi:hypothetical protein